MCRGRPALIRRSRRPTIGPQHRVVAHRRARQGGPDYSLGAWGGLRRFKSLARRMTVPMVSAAVMPGPAMLVP